MNFARRCLRAPVAAGCVALVIVLGACSGGGGDTPKAAAPAGTTLKLDAGDVVVDAAGAPGTLAAADQDAIIETLRKYVIAATVDPMHGKKVGNLTAVFTADAAASLSGLNRASVIDDGVPKATSTVKAIAGPVTLTALSDQSGAIDMVGATLFLDVNAKARTGPMRVLRTGELIVKRDAGAWKISSYKLTVDRTGSGFPTPTSSSTGASTP
jgi:hypothetical protein